MGLGGLDESRRGEAVGEEEFWGKRGDGVRYRKANLA
jgi:hypothetical protein